MFPLDWLIPLFAHLINFCFFHFSLFLFYFSLFRSFSFFRTFSKFWTNRKNTRTVVGAWSQLLLYYGNYFIRFTFARNGSSLYFPSASFFLSFSLSCFLLPFVNWTTSIRLTKVTGNGDFIHGWMAVSNTSFLLVDFTQLIFSSLSVFCSSSSPSFSSSFSCRSNLLLVTNPIHLHLQWIFKSWKE